MQRKFANLLVSNEGRKYGYECAIEAGYEKDRSRQTAYELQNPKLYPLVVKYIGEIREEYQKKYEVTYEKHITELAKIREQALKKGAFSAASNAEVARGKAAGLYVEQKIIRTGKLDDMSKAEMEEELKKIIDEYSKKLEKYQIRIDRIFSAEYLNKNYKNKGESECQIAARLKYDNDENEVHIIKKISKKQPFFERFFRFFN